MCVCVKVRSTYGGMAEVYRMGGAGNDPRPGTSWSGGYSVKGRNVEDAARIIAGRDVKCMTGVRKRLR